jgi:crotonobetainyl-CoA:carnitine CoA-transferase CaiB-like acyl-CoA transferase
MDLSDYTILDLTWLLPGPYGSMLLADMGAEVIKIEEPERGDYARWLVPTVEPTEYSGLYHSVNRNKKSVTIDLKSEEGREVFLDLATKADVIFEQFRPGVVDRLGIGYEDIREENEDIVYVSLTGYGQDGPYGDRVGHDLNYAGVAGLLSETVSKDGEFPAIPSYPIGDMVGGMFSSLMIVSALLSRESGTSGQYIDVSMTDVVASLGSGWVWRETMGEKVPEDEQSLSDLINPCYDIYETKDGGYITVAAQEEKFWDRLLEELDREDLSYYQYARGGEAAYAREELQSEFLERTQDEWMAYLSEETMTAPVNEFGEMLDHPQIRAREMVIEQDVGDDTFSSLGFPAKCSTEINDTREMAPQFGEHTREVLSRVLSEEQLDELERDQVI